MRSADRASLRAKATGKYKEGDEWDESDEGA